MSSNSCIFKPPKLRGRIVSAVKVDYSCENRNREKVFQVHFTKYEQPSREKTPDLRYMDECNGACKSLSMLM